MSTTFKYNNKLITTPNLEKKLKQMKITLDDIEIIDIPIKKEDNEPNNTVLYYFYNPITKYKQCSIYNTCEEGYVQITKEEYYNQGN